MKLSLSVPLSISALLLLDQLTKYLVRTNFYVGETFPVAPFFQLTYVTNTGVAFSMFRGMAGANVFFALFNIAVIAALTWWLTKQRLLEYPLVQGAFILIAAGALGNLIDRVLFGHVIDFLDFYAGAWHWPVFNIADSCITVGGITLFFSLSALKKL